MWNVRDQTHIDPAQGKSSPHCTIFPAPESILYSVLTQLLDNILKVYVYTLYFLFHFLVLGFLYLLQIDLYYEDYIMKFYISFIIYLWGGGLPVLLGDLRTTPSETSWYSVTGGI